MTVPFKLMYKFPNETEYVELPEALDRMYKELISLREEVKQLKSQQNNSNLN